MRQWALRYALTHLGSPYVGRPTANLSYQAVVFAAVRTFLILSGLVHISWAQQSVVLLVVVLVVVVLLVVIIVTRSTSLNQQTSEHFLPDTRFLVTANHVPSIT